MEGKIAIMSALLVSLVFLGQIQVEAKSCCPTTLARNAYNICRLGGTIPRPICATTTGCKIVTGNICPPGYPKDILQNTGNVAYMMEDKVGFTSCCPNATARGYFDRCRLIPEACAENSGCFLLRGMRRCPSGWTSDILKNTAVNEYCKLGCVSSACGAITTLQISDASEIVNGAVEKCTNACSDFCTKGSITAVETD